MSFITDPYTVLRLYELSHVWNSEAPSYPGQDDVAMKRGVKHAQHGVLAWRIRTSLHTGTHMIAPLYVLQKSSDLAGASSVREGDIVVIDTGWHHKYSDSLEYYGEAPGLTEEAAKWLVAKKVKFVAVDTPFVDHPLATSMGPHRGGPLMKRLAGEYQNATGKDPKAEHGKWFIAERTLAEAGIPVVVQVGGALDDLKGKRATFAATPWKLEHGDACPVRMVAMTDPSGELRIDEGKGA